MGKHQPGRRERYKWALSPALEQRLGANSYGAQRALLEEGQLLLVLHAPPTGDAPRQHEVFLRLPTNEAQGEWLYKGSKGGQFEMTRLLDAYDAQLNELTEALDVAETSSALFEIIGRCIPLSRAASNLQKALQSGRELIADDAWLIDQRDRAVDVSRSFELLLADARLELDYRLARATEWQARATEAVTRGQRKLNTIAALTFPVMALGAALGMNLRTGLEGVSPALFWLLVCGGIALGLGVRAWIGRDKG